MADVSVEATIKMTIPEGWPALTNADRSSTRTMVEAFEQEFGRVVNAMHDLHPDVRMDFEVRDSESAVRARGRSR